jgi:hypothetical protein
MLRVFFTIVLPLVLPTAIYLLWLRIASWSQRGEITGWAALPWLWLAGAGALLLALVLLVVAGHYGTSGPGTYVAPRWENGRIIPGHIEPKPNP